MLSSSATLNDGLVAHWQLDGPHPDPQPVKHGVYGTCDPDGQVRVRVYDKGREVRPDSNGFYNVLAHEPEVSVWNSALSDEEINQLQRGLNFDSL